ncbi:MAG TPA: Gmad2 immunoglobulin-like domain-containing protein [Verrucomicrobiales bacterium]|nr:Gmad2 immunoglobulin-like domain-containing protein [Verrucomicrobiales bacterium]
MKRFPWKLAAAAILGVAGLAGCASTSLDVCSNADGALNGAFVFVTSPSPGQRVSSGFAAHGCSRTFESNVQWRLRARSGALLASGFTSGGGVDGPAGFAFTVSYSVAERQIGHLEVFEEDASDGEGFPPPRCVIPLVLQP